MSLDPSIGNWSLACQSHYWIREDKVRWARRWGADEVAAGVEADRRAKAAYFREGERAPAVAEPSEGGKPPAPARVPGTGWWRSFVRWLFGER